MSGRSHFNHQTWQSGRNVVRYVPKDDVQDLQQSIDGYATFMKLAQQYADEIIRLTRNERTKRGKSPSATQDSAKTKN